MVHGEEGAAASAQEVDLETLLERLEELERRRPRWA